MLDNPIAAILIANFREQRSNGERLRWVYLQARELRGLASLATVPALVNAEAILDAFQYAIPIVRVDLQATDVAWKDAALGVLARDPQEWTEQDLMALVGKSTPPTPAKGGPSFNSGWAHDLYEAHKAGKLSHEKAKQILLNLSSSFARARYEAKRWKDKEASTLILEILRTYEQ